MPTYRKKDLPGFEHLLVIGIQHDYSEDGSNSVIGLVEVVQLVNADVVIGDRHPKLPIRPGSLFISADNLEETDEGIELEQFAVDNPFGEYKYEGRLERERLVITYAVYENAITITISEKGGVEQTLYSDNFFASRQAALELVENTLHGDMDPDDLIFELQTLKEKHG